MSRSGYSYDLDNLELGRWRGRVASAIRGKNGQTFLREMLTALDAIPSKTLTIEELAKDGEVCALGAVGVARKLDMSKLDPYDRETVAATFGIKECLAFEIMDINDRCNETPEQRFSRVRAWVVKQLKEPQESGSSGSAL